MQLPAVPDGPRFPESFGAVLQELLQAPGRPGVFMLRNHGQEYDEDGEPLPMTPVPTHTLLPIIDGLWPGPRRLCGPAVHPRLRDRQVDRALLGARRQRVRSPDSEGSRSG